MAKKKATKKIKKNRKTSKFVSKYSQRIESIKQSDEIRQQNIKLEEERKSKKKNKK